MKDKTTMNCECNEQTNLFDFFKEHENEFSMKDMLKFEKLRNRLKGGPMIYEQRKERIFDDEQVIWPASLKFSWKKGTKVLKSFANIPGREIKVTDKNKILMDITKEEFQTLSDNTIVGYYWNGFFFSPIPKSIITQILTPEGVYIDVK